MAAAPNRYAQFRSEVQFSGDITDKAQLSEKLQGTLFLRGQDIDLRILADEFWPISNGGKNHKTSQRISADGYSEYTASGSVADVYISDKRNFGHVFDLIGYGSVLSGIVPSSDGLGLGELLRTSPNVQIRPEPEKINSEEAIVVEFDTKYGNHTLWLSPSRQYMPIQIQVTREKGDLFNGVPVGTPPAKASPEAIHTWPREAVSGNVVTILFDRFSTLGDAVVPISASIESTITYESGKSVVVRTTHELSNLQLDPDFDAMNAFKLDAPDGTPAAFLDERGATGLRFQWVDGEMVPAIDTTVFNKIEGQLSNANDVIAINPEINAQELAKESAPLRNASGGNAWLFYLAGGLAVLSCLISVLFARARRAGQ